MSGTVRLSVGMTAVVVVSAVMLAAAGASAGASTAVTGTPNPSKTDNELYAVSASSASDAWAAGYYASASGPSATLTLHWNGAKWVKVTSPNPDPSQFNQLYGVSDQSSRNAWAVGYYLGPSSPFPVKDMILHWDGVKWAQVTSPDPSSTTNMLAAVSADSPTDAWAVGNWANGSVTDTLALHWNGTRWSKTPTPSPSTPINALTGVVALSPANAWAVGYYYNATTQHYDTLALHWNGKAWSQVPSPSPAAENHLYGVSASGPDDVWAVGATCATVSAQCGSSGGHTLILHWNGTKWAMVKSPDPSTKNNVLKSVGADARTDAWATGFYTNDTTGATQTLTVHWNGTKWATVKSPDPSASTNNLFGASARTSTDAWAVGFYINSKTKATDTLALHWNGTKWTKN